MKVLLVAPRFSEFSYWNYREVCELFEARYPAAPLGLVTVAALLPREWDIPVSYTHLTLPTNREV